MQAMPWKKVDGKNAIHILAVAIIIEHGGPDGLPQREKEKLMIKIKLEDYPEVECYGDLEENSNFEIVCEDEDEDTCWCDGNSETDKPFETWEEVVKVLKDEFNSTILEIHAVWHGKQ